MRFGRFDFSVLVNTLRAPLPSFALAPSFGLSCSNPVALREYIPESRSLDPLIWGHRVLPSTRRGSVHRAFVHYRLSACGIGD